MKQFFHFKISQKLPVKALILSTIFLVSCASHQKAKLRDEKVNKVVQSARSFTGTPYKYGGTTRAGMDCSGLLLNAFRSIDLSLPRSSEDQSKVGQEVKMKDVRPGDLVFFATGKKKRKITHVGLVTERKSKNDIRFIHASSSLGVVEVNLFAEYYKNNFREARRVIKNP